MLCWSPFSQEGKLKLSPGGEGGHRHCEWDYGAHAQRPEVTEVKAAMVLDRDNSISPNIPSALKIAVSIFKTYLIYELIKKKLEGLAWICEVKFSYT
jgi:hypothetical protein